MNLGTNSASPRKIHKLNYRNESLPLRFKTPLFFLEEEGAGGDEGLIEENLYHHPIN